MKIDFEKLIAGCIVGVVSAFLAAWVMLVTLLPFVVPLAVLWIAWHFLTKYW